MTGRAALLLSICPNNVLGRPMKNANWLIEISQILIRYPNGPTGYKTDGRAAKVCLHSVPDCQ